MPRLAGLGSSSWNIPGAITFKKRLILGTLLAYGISLSVQMATLPYIDLATDREEVAIAEAAGMEATELALGQTITPNPAVASEVEIYVRDYFADVPVLAEIARCESAFRHHNPKTGAILRGTVNSNDIGVMQINTYYHHDTALKLGFDIETLDGNLEYARYLYELEGTRPWSASRACWGAKHLAIR